MPTRTKTTTRTRPRERTDTRREPPWRVLLHDDDVHTMEFVALVLQEVFGFARREAWAVMSEAHCTGVALCAVEPRPVAGRHRDAMRSRGLTATVEPDAA